MLPRGADLSTILGAFDIAGAAIGVFAAARLTRRKRNGADRLLSLILIVCSANIVHGAIAVRPHVEDALILEPLQFLLPLGIVWYLRSLRGRRVLAPADAINLVLPALFIAASYVPRLVEARLPNGLPALSLVMWLAMDASSAFLMIPVARDIHRYRSELKREYSSLSGIDPGWLGLMLVLMAALFFLYALLAVLMIHAPGLAPRPALAALTSAFTIALAWASLGKGRSFSRDRGDGKAIESPATDRRETTQEPEAGQRAKARELIAIIEGQRLFLEPELSLDDLAHAAGMSRHLASEALNRGLGVSFFDLVNGYRVEEYKRLCAEPGRKRDKIMTLAFDAGFNSKPSFNLVFKKTTGLTPSQYRASAQIESRPIA